MSLITFVSAKGSPGVTTTVTSLAALWPADQAAALEGGPGPEPVLPPRDGEL